MSLKYLYTASILILAGNIPAQAQTTEPDSEKVMVVLDASGSMWGQIDGKTKIEIVRDAYGKLVKGWDSENVSSGLIAYGHRRKGDCSDIELLSKPGQTDSHSLGRMAYKLTPKGKTPLGDAVRMAAQELRYTEQKATVILLSDGIETCGVDPCQLGLDLENLGVDFTAHVVGLDIKTDAEKSQLQCLADNTGGRFVSADNATELEDALTQTAVLNDGLTFQGLIADTGEPASHMQWDIAGPHGKVTLKTDSSTLNTRDFPEGGLANGSYVVTGWAENYAGSTNFTIPSDDDVIYVRLFPDILATELKVLDDVFAGDEFQVQWVGESHVDDQISIVPVGGNWDSAIDTVRVTTGNPVKLTAPKDTGTYELIYRNNSYENNRIDARITFNVQDTAYALEPVGIIRAGQRFQVKWRGPGLEPDMIAIGPRTSGTDDYYSLDWIEDQELVSLNAPSEPGDYELRYYGDGYQLQFVQPVTVK